MGIWGRKVLHNTQKVKGWGGGGGGCSNTAQHDLMPPCIATCKLVLNAFWLPSHLHSQLSTCHNCLPEAVCVCMQAFNSACVLHVMCMHPCTLRVHGHILRAFIHTNEQRFWAIYRVAILAHHMCQLLLSKWPQTVWATAGKVGGKVGRTNESACSQSQGVCLRWVCERLGAAGHCCRQTGSQDTHVRKCTGNSLCTHTHTHTHTETCMCTHAAHQQVEPVQCRRAASESQLVVKFASNWQQTCFSVNPSIIGLCVCVCVCVWRDLERGCHGERERGEGQEQHIKDQGAIKSH